MAGTNQLEVGSFLMKQQEQAFVALQTMKMQKQRLSNSSKKFRNVFRCPTSPTISMWTLVGIAGLV